jgi:glycosyltransferase involved in cell wall biosynthesis
MKNDILYLVLPCYNEEETLEDSHKKLSVFLGDLIKAEKISDKSMMLFVDDGSGDRTWEIISSLSESDPMVSGIKLAHNRGHQVAIYAGIEEATQYADVIITIDVDLQQDINAIPDFLTAYEEGCDVVYGVRNDRKSDGFFKKTTAALYYKLMRMAGADLIPNSADYRLLSKKAAEALMLYKERNLFIRGIVPDMGFKSSIVHFDVHERELGKSKYTLHKMLRLAADGITSFSIVPIRLILYFGILVLLYSIGVIIHDVYVYLIGDTITGWASLQASIWFFGSVQLISIGIVGEYIGRIYMESKHRPRYIVEQKKNLKKHNTEHESES